MNHHPLPSQEWLLESYEYSPTTGELTSKRTGRPLRGEKNKKGYIRDKIDGVNYFRHRIIWMIMTGEDPGELTVDHYDDVKDNNKWENLSLLTRLDNIIKSNDGKRGSVYPHGSGYRCEIWIDTVRHRSYHKTYEDALSALETLQRSL